jgi:Tol biopolymer transport system component
MLSAAKHLLADSRKTLRFAQSDNSLRFAVNEVSSMKPIHFCMMLLAFVATSCVAPTVTLTPMATVAPTPTSSVDPCLTTAKTYKPGSLPPAQIAFECYTDPYGAINIYVFDTTTGKIVNLTNNAYTNEDIQWSPDGQFIAFNRKDGIDLMDADGSQATRLIEGGSPHWSPDGRFIAFNGKDGIYTIGVANRQVTHLTNRFAVFAGSAWSPDGKRIAFSGLLNEHTDIFTVNADGSHEINLTNNGNEDVYPTWSPDGKYIAFQSYRDGNGEIYLTTIDGREQINLTNSPEDESPPLWSPVGQHIAFTASSSNSGLPKLFIMNTDGSHKRLLTDSPVAEPTWSLDGDYLVSLTSNCTL